MARSEKKYEVAPGVDVPDIKAIMSAAADFSKSEIGEVNIHNYQKTDSKKSDTKKTVNSPEVEGLKALGQEVAENEEKIKLESQKKMESIKANAVMKPESLDTLSKRAQTEVDPEKLKEIERVKQERLAKEMELKEKEKQRAERRAQQRQKVESIIAKGDNKVVTPVDRKNAANSDDKADSNKANPSVVASDEDTLESFSEFL